MRKLSWMLLALLVLAGCGEEITTGEEKPKFQDVEEAVEEDVGLKERITWDKDGAEMALVPAGSFEMGDAMNEPEGWMERSKPLHKNWVLFTWISMK